MSNDIPGLALRAVLGPLTTLQERLAGRDGELWLSRLNQFNRGENPFATSADRSRITPAESVVIPPIRILVKNVFATKDEEGDSLFGRREFKVALAESKATKKFLARGYKLQESLSLRKMLEVAGGEEEVRRKHLFTPDQILLLVNLFTPNAGFLMSDESQEEGRVGPLLINGYLNFFFVELLDGSLGVVGVGWDDRTSSWSAYSFSVTDDYSWYIGDRLFLRDV